MPTEAQLARFCELYFQRTGKRLTMAEAKQESYKLLQLMRSVYQPIPKLPSLTNGHETEY